MLSPMYCMRVTCALFTFLPRQDIFVTIISGHDCLNVFVCYIEFKSQFECNIQNSYFECELRTITHRNLSRAIAQFKLSQFAEV